MEELKLTVPTYLANVPSESELALDFGPPDVPILIHEAEGVRIVLGSHDYKNSEMPDVQIERRPNGWAIFLHPVGGCDASGYVYFLDDGKSFLVPEAGFESNRGGIQVLDPQADVPEVDQLQPTPLVKESEVMPSAVIENDC